MQSRLFSWASIKDVPVILSTSNIIESIILFDGKWRTEDNMITGNNIIQINKALIALIERIPERYYLK